VVNGPRKIEVRVKKKEKGLLSVLSVGTKKLFPIYIYIYIYIPINMFIYAQGGPPAPAAPQQERTNMLRLG
jgi:hypothetical protein